MRSKLNTIYFFFCWKGSDAIVQKKELIEQIRKLNVKIATSNKELEKLERLQVLVLISFLQKVKIM